MKKYAMETAVGIFVAVGLLCVGYLTVKLGNVAFFEGDQYRVLARFTSVSGLRPGSSVQMYGIEVGRVEKLGMDAQAQQAQVEMLIRKEGKIAAEPFRPEKSDK